jgi:multicomponent Na+:H+ antiporter subunit F
MITITGITLYILVPLMLCSLLCLYALFKGPTSPDRVLAFQVFGVIVVSFCAFANVLFRRRFLMDVAICWTLLGFITVLVLSKYLEGRDLDE